VQVDLVLFDIPGSSTFNAREVAGMRHWESAGALVVVFDIGSRESFSSVAKWVRRAQEARAAIGAAGFIPGVLVGNKSDFREAGTERAEVSVAEAKALADSLKMQYFEVSAERNADVERPFLHIASITAKAQLDEGE
jgi:GTPase SAR1 family protein